MSGRAALAALLLIGILAGCSAPPLPAPSQEAASIPPSSMEVAPSGDTAHQPPGEPSQEAASIPPSSMETAPPGDAADPPDRPVNRAIRVRLTFAGGEAVALLTDSPTTQSLLEQLPVTVTIQDFAGAEKVFYLPESLSREGAPEGYDPALGDVACYGPWGNVALFYRDQPYAAGLIPMGHLKSGLDALSAQSGSFEAVLEEISDLEEEKS